MLRELEYMDKKRFPLTTQDGLDYSGQQLIDSFNWDEGLRRMREEMAGIDREGLLRFRELEVKLERSFIEDIANIMNGVKVPYELFLTYPCKKCGQVNNLHNKLCVFCDRGLELDTGNSEGGEWYRELSKKRGEK